MLTRKEAGIVECRICGLNFLPELQEDRDRHEHEHRRIICGGVPYEVREFLKRFGWAVARKQLKEGWDPEIGKRAVVFAWWMRALSNGIPENDCNKFMAAQFLFIDASISGDKAAREEGSKAIEPWVKYGG